MEIRHFASAFMISSSASLLFCSGTNPGCTLQIPEIRVQEQLVYGNSEATNRAFLPLASNGGRIITYWNGIKRVINPIEPRDQILGTSLRNGIIYSILLTKKCAKLISFNIEDPSNQWREVGDINASNGCPQILIPLDDHDRFIGISHVIGFTEKSNDKSSFVAIFRKSGKKIQFDSCAEMPFGTMNSITRKVPLKFNQEKAEKDDGWPESACELIEPIFVPSLWCPSMSNTHVAVCAPTAGVIWTFELSHGRLRNVVDIFGIQRNQHQAFAALQFLILGTGFRPDGQLIVCSKSVELVDLFKSLQAESLDRNSEKYNPEALKMFCDEFKDVRWWIIDPETGHIDGIDSPTEFPTKIPEMGRQLPFKFVIDMQGWARTNAFTKWSSVIADLGLSETLPSMTPSHKGHP